MCSPFREEAGCGSRGWIQDRETGRPGDDDSVSPIPSSGESHRCKMRHVTPASHELPVVSLFSGAGGLDLAVTSCAGSRKGSQRSHGPLRVAVALDNDATALSTLEANSPGVTTMCADITTVSSRDILSAGQMTAGDPCLVVGGPPCTPFSKSGFWLDYKRESRDPNASLLDEFVRVVSDARPEAFVLENVQGLTYSTHREQFERLLRGLGDAGYSTSWRLLNAADYGVPQLRKRVFVVGRRDRKVFRFPEATHAGWTEHTLRYDESKQPYVTAGEAIKDLLPGEPEADEVVEGQFADLLASIPPGENYLWHSERGGGDPIFRWRSRYWTFLLRLDPDRPSTTIQAQPGPWVGPFHWENVRGPSGEERARRLRLPELLRLMTFPDDFVVVGDRRSFQRQLGNAVPVELGKVVVTALLEQLGHI